MGHGRACMDSWQSWVCRFLYERVVGKAMVYEDDGHWLSDDMLLSKAYASCLQTCAAPFHPLRTRAPKQPAPVPSHPFLAPALHLSLFSSLSLSLANAAM